LFNESKMSKDRELANKIKEVNNRRQAEQGKSKGDPYKGVQFTPAERDRLNRNNKGK
jgi:hypothetical protein